MDSGSSVVYSSGSGSSASAVYSNNAGDDDFTPLLPVVIDNGKIFAFAEVSVPTSVLCCSNCFLLVRRGSVRHR